MIQKTNNSEVKRLNRNRVFRYINSKNRTSMPDIAAALDMSGPTVLQIVKELREARVVCEAGEFESTGGRKARALAAVRDARYAVGIEITRHHIGMVLTDMTETVLKYERTRKPFVCEDEYFKQLGEALDEFLGDDGTVKEKIAGVGISVPSIVDGTANRITYSRALNLYDIDGDVFSRYIPYPCVLLNDANAAAVTECIADSQLESMIYLSLSNTVGGAVVFRQDPAREDVSGPLNSVFENMYIGKHWHSGEFGHMVIHPGGKTCYCGKKGCVDAYCSALCLAEHTDGYLERFFDRLEDEDAELMEVWELYLDDLAITVDNLRMCFDCDIVLGGYVGSCIGPYMKELQKRVEEKNIFEGNGEYVRACKYQKAASALGAAVYYIENFINSI